MKNFTKLCLLAAAALPTSAYAADGTGFYGSLSVGGASVNNVDTTVFAPGGQIFPVILAPDSLAAASVPAGSDTIEGKFKLKSAFQISGSLGYDFGLVRTDVEVSYARSKIKSFAVTKLTSPTLGTATLDADTTDVCAYIDITPCPISGNTIDLSGANSKLRQLNAMASVWVDIPLGLPVQPYVGGGLGVAGFELDGEGKSRFAWQLGGGVAFPLSSNLSLTADVRYRRAKGVTFNDAGYGTEVGAIKTFTYGVGVRFTF